MSTMSKNQAKKLINELFNDVPNVWQGFKLMRDHLHELNVKAEKEHRKGAYSKSYNFPISDTAKYFTVKQLFEGMASCVDNGFSYQINHLLGIRYEVLLAQAYAMENTEKLTEWYKLVKESEFNTLDYCELIK